MIGLAPLNALRAFEAAARRGGFAAAADELNVTPAAVGQQVRHLEALIGAPLFDRAGRQLVLTQRGVAALAPLQRGFELMGEASAAMRDPHSAQAIALAAPREVLTAWIGADLARWTGQAAIELTALSAPDNATAAFKAGADLAIVFTTAPGGGGRRLMGETLAPLAAPNLALEGEGLDRLTSAALIEDASLATGWAQWAVARGAYGADLSAQVRTADSLSALSLATAGAGIVLARKPLALDAIRSGALTPVLPDGDWPISAGYALIAAPGRPLNPAAADLADHLSRCAALRLDLSGEL